MDNVCMHVRLMMAFPLLVRLDLVVMMGRKRGYLV